MKIESVSFMFGWKRSFSLTSLAMLVSTLLAVTILFRLSSPSSLEISENYDHCRISRSSAESSIGAYRSPRTQTGTWFGNTWIPPSGWKLYSKKELQEFYREKSVLWIGDSTARRAAMTLYAILNSTAQHISVEEISNTTVINVNKGKTTEKCTLELKRTIPLNICRAMPFSEGKTFLQTNGPFCAHTLDEFIQEEVAGNSTITQDIDLIIISMGVWDGLGKCGPRTREQVFTNLNRTIARLDTLQARGKTIVWRTSGFDEQARSFRNIPPVNEYVMDVIDENVLDYQQRGMQSNLTYVDWGGAIEPRSRRPERISGDMHSHYGVEPRLVLIQMITNVLSGL